MRHLIKTSEACRCSLFWSHPVLGASCCPAVGLLVCRCCGEGFTVRPLAYVLCLVNEPQLLGVGGTCRSRRQGWIPCTAAHPVVSAHFVTHPSWPRQPLDSKKCFRVCMWKIFCKMLTVARGKMISLPCALQEVRGRMPQK